jgi:ribosomal protein S6--L-glutamate ligase
MRCISFNPFRSLGIPGVISVKPERLFQEAAVVRTADWVLFPEYWQINVLAHVFRRPTFPSVATYRLGHDKVECTRALLAHCPAHVPQTLILPNEARAAEQVLDTFGMPFVAKTVRASAGQGVFLIENRRDWERYRTAHDVLYVQEYLPLRRDLRVVVVGEEAVTAYWREVREGGFKTNVAAGGVISFEDVPGDVVVQVAAVARALGVDHAGFDVAEADGHFVFFEFNPYFGLRGVQAARVPLAERILAYLQRCQPDRPTFPAAA